MVTYPGLPGPVISDFLGREASRGHYAEGTTFHIARIRMVANTGTYLDSPFHRFAHGKDVAGLPLERLADLPGLVIDATEKARGRRLDDDLFAGRDISGRAVLVRTGWDAHWRTPRYAERHPHLTRAAAQHLAARGSGSRGHRLAEHRRHRRRRPSRAHAAALGRDPDRRAPHESRRASRGRLPLPRGSGAVSGARQLLRPGLRGTAVVALQPRARPV